MGGLAGVSAVLLPSCCSGTCRAAGQSKKYDEANKNNRADRRLQVNAPPRWLGESLGATATIFCILGPAPENSNRRSSRLTLFDWFVAAGESGVGAFCGGRDDAPYYTVFRWTIRWQFNLTWKQTNLICGGRKRGVNHQDLFCWPSRGDSVARPDGDRSAGAIFPENEEIPQSGDVSDWSTGFNLKLRSDLYGLRRRCSLKLNSARHWQSCSTATCKINGVCHPFTDFWQNFFNRKTEPFSY